MIKNKIVAIAGAVIVVILILVGIQISKPSPFSKQAEADYIKQYMDIALKPAEPQELIDNLKGNIDRLNKQDASNTVDALLFSMHQFAPDMDTKVKSLQTVFLKYEAKNINFNDVNDIDKIDDDMLKAFLVQMNKRHFLTEKFDGEYFVKPDIQFVLDKYEKYMTEDLKALTVFSIKESMEQFFDKKKNMFNLDLVVERIITVENNIKKFPNSYYQPSMKDSKNYYLQVYLGTNSEFLVDANKRVLPDVLAHYKATIAKYPDSQLAKDLKDFTAKLNKSDNIVTANIAVYLLDITGTKTTDTKQEDTKVNAETNSDVKDAVKEAIEKNK